MFTGLWYKNTQKNGKRKGQKKTVRQINKFFFLWAFESGDAQNSMRQFARFWLCFFPLFCLCCSMLHICCPFFCARFHFFTHKTREKERKKSEEWERKERERFQISRSKVRCLHLFSRSLSLSLSFFSYLFPPPSYHSLCLCEEMCNGISAMWLYGDK